MRDAMKYINWLLVLFFTSTLHAQEWEFEIVQPQQVSEVEKEYYVVMFTADYCSQCRVSKRDDIPKLTQMLPGTRLIDVQKKPEWTKPKRIRSTSGSVNYGGIHLLPTYWLVEKDSSGRESVVKEWVGKTSAETILSELEPTKSVLQTSKPNVVELNSNIYDGELGSSHQNRNSLINHLLYGGVHRGKHTQQSLNSMTDEQLNSIHNQDHNGSK